MELQIIGKNMQVSDDVQEFIHKKVEKLDRHFPQLSQGTVEVAHEPTKSSQRRYVVQITLAHKGALLRGEGHAADVHTAINGAVAVMDRQVARYKGKLYDKGGKLDLATENNPVCNIVREKRFLLKAMSAEDAVEQMELLGHDFFMFISETSNQYCLVYRRQDEDYGLIEGVTK